MPWHPTNPKFFTAHRRLRPSLSDRFLKCEVWNKNQQKLSDLRMCQAIPNSIAMAHLLGQTNWMRRKALICSAKHHSMFIAFPISLFFHFKTSTSFESDGKTLNNWGVPSAGVCAPLSSCQRTRNFVFFPRKQESFSCCLDAAQCQALVVISVTV